MGWVCPTCHTCNDDGDTKCIVCDYDVSALRKKEKWEKLMEKLEKLPKVVVFAMIILSLTAITINIVHIEADGSVINTLVARAQYAVRNVSVEDMLARVDRLDEYSPQFSDFGLRLKSLSGRVAPNINVSLVPRISYLVQAVKDKTAGLTKKE